MASQLVNLSKLLSLVLRHNPQKIGITLDAQGWVPVSELLEKINQFGIRIDMPLLEQGVEENNKQRFAFNADKSRIRASQGHSVPIELGYQPQTPPDVLYHGTATRFMQAIRQEGLKKGSRHHVHLSVDVPTATNVGTRHGVPVILPVDARQMHQDGYDFFVSENGVWLTDYIPPKYIRFGA